MFVLIGTAALTVLFVLFARSDRRRWFLHVGLALVMAGAVGNIYDRVVHGRVRDFIHVTTNFSDLWGRWPAKPIWPWIWNIADAALVVGVAAILLSHLHLERAAHAATRRTAQSKTAR